MMSTLHYTCSYTMIEAQCSSIDDFKKEGKKEEEGDYEELVRVAVCV